MMIYVLVLCGLALEAFRLSIAAGAIQANLTKRKIILLGGIFAAVQLVLFLLGMVCLWKWTDFLSVSGNLDNIAKIGSVIFTVLGFAMIFLGIREKRLEESCIHPWSVEGFAQYAFKHGLMFLCVGCAAIYCMGKIFWYGLEIFFDFISSFSFWFGLWILAGNQRMAENAHCDRMYLGCCSSVSVDNLKSIMKFHHDAKKNYLCL